MSGHLVVAQGNSAAFYQPGAWLDEADLRQIPWRAHDLAEGESISGVVLRKPTARAFNGSRVFIGTPDEVIGMHATAKTGHTVLERELQDIDPGDQVTITFFGKRQTWDGEREYRFYKVVRL